MERASFVKGMKVTCCQKIRINISIHTIVFVFIVSHYQLICVFVECPRFIDLGSNQGDHRHSEATLLVIVESSAGRNFDVDKYSGTRLTRIMFWRF